MMDEIIQAVIDKKTDMEREYGPVNMNTQSLERWIRLINHDASMARASSMAQMDVAACRYILSTAAICMQALEAHGLPYDIKDIMTGENHMVADIKEDV